MTQDKKRELVRSQGNTAPISWCLGALNLSKTAWYYTEKEQDERKIIEDIKSVLLEYPYYGYRRVTQELKRKNIDINHKKTKRIMKENLLLQAKESKNYKPKTTDSTHNLLVYPNAIELLSPLAPCVIWVADITYVWIGERWAYVAIVLDQGSRKVVGWSISKSMHRQLCIDALTMALGHNPAPEFHHSDRGVQYCSHEYIDLLKENNITPSMASVGVSVDNPHAESFNRTLKVEEVYLHAYESFEEARDFIGSFIKVYNTKRLHSSLGYVPPIEFEDLYYQTH